MLRLQQLPFGTVVDLIGAEHVIGRLGGDCRQHQLGPALVNQNAGEVIDVKPLHRNAHETVRQIIEAAQGGIAEPLDRAASGDFRIGVIGLDRIIDDQHPATATGQRAAHRGGKAKPALCRLEFTFGGFFRVQSRPGKHAFVKRCFEQRPAVAREFRGQLVGVAGANDAGTRRATQDPCRQSHRDEERFERARRQVHDQSLASLAVDHELEVIADHIDMPVWDQALAGVKGRECPVGKDPEVGPIECVGDISIDFHAVRPFLPSEARRRGPKRRRINSSSSSIDAFSDAAGSAITRA